MLDRTINKDAADSIQIPASTVKFHQAKHVEEVIDVPTDQCLSGRNGRM